MGNSQKGSTTSESRYCFLLERPSDDLLIFLLEFNQRTDRLALKLTCKRFYNNPRLPNYAAEKEIYEEIMLYLLDIDNLDYSWKDSPHMRVRIAPNLSEYNIHRRYIQTNNLWWFNFFGVYHNIYPGDYIFSLYTTVRRFETKLRLFRNNEDHHFDEITVQKNAPTRQITYSKIKITEKCSKVEVVCKETNEYKHDEIVTFMILIPEYYFSHLKKYIAKST